MREFAGTLVAALILAQIAAVAEKCGVSALVTGLVEVLADLVVVLHSECAGPDFEGGRSEELEGRQEVGAGAQVPVGEAAVLFLVGAAVVGVFRAFSRLVDEWVVVYLLEVVG